MWHYSILQYNRLSGAGIQSNDQQRRTSLWLSPMQLCAFYRNEQLCVFVKRLERYTYNIIQKAIQRKKEKRRESKGEGSHRPEEACSRRWTGSLQSWLQWEAHSTTGRPQHTWPGNSAVESEHVAQRFTTGTRKVGGSSPSEATISCWALEQGP